MGSGMMGVRREEEEGGRMRRREWEMEGWELAGTGGWMDRGGRKAAIRAVVSCAPAPDPDPWRSPEAPWSFPESRKGRKRPKTFPNGQR
eukprot:3671438-Pyramimonas_sp.AAC.1